MIPLCIICILLHYSMHDFAIPDARQKLIFFTSNEIKLILKGTYQCQANVLPSPVRGPRIKQKYRGEGRQEMKDPVLKVETRLFRQGLRVSFLRPGDIKEPVCK
jgi:hypothetical protein